MGKTINTPENVSINGVLFEEFRKQFDMVLIRLLNNLSDKNILEGKMSVTFSVNLTEAHSEYEPDRLKYIPMIRAKIVSSYQEKDDSEAIIGGADCEMIDSDDHGWIVRMADGGQMSLDV